MKKIAQPNRKKSFKSQFKDGFSLIELMVVIVIIGILTTFAIPSYNRYVEKTEFTNAYNYANAIKPYVLEYALTRSNFSGLNANNLGLEDTNVLNSANIASVDVVVSSDDDKVLTVTFNLTDNVEVNENDENANFSLVADYQSGAISWSCNTSGIETYYRPSNCTASQ